MYEQQNIYMIHIINVHVHVAMTTMIDYIGTYCHDNNDRLYWYILP